MAPSSAGVENNHGQLGRGDTQNTGISATYPANVQLVQLGGSGGGTGTASSVFASGFRTCAMVTGRGLVCWGYNTAGQLGYSNTTAQCNASGLAPSGLGVVSFGSLTLSSLAIAPEFSCALLSDGNVRCWGLDSNGQLGLGGALPSLGYVGGTATTTPNLDSDALIFTPVDGGLQ